LNTLETLLVILDGQKLLPGYLTPLGDGTALGTVRALRQQFDPFTLLSNPLAKPAVMFTPAYVSSDQGRDAIYLDGVDGNLAMAAGPAYVFANPTS
jgi:hypothetical protein